MRKINNIDLLNIASVTVISLSLVAIAYDYKHINDDQTLISAVRSAVSEENQVNYRDLFDRAYDVGYDSAFDDVENLLDKEYSSGFENGLREGNSKLYDDAFRGGYKKGLKEKKKSESKKVSVKPITKKEEREFWRKLYAIESRSGKSLFRPSNKSGNCNTTKYACGHHQLTKPALQNLSICKGKLKQCMADRTNKQKSLKMAKLYIKELHRQGCYKFVPWLMYTSYNQGCNGIKRAIKASRGKMVLSYRIKRNIANNVPKLFKYRKNRKKLNSLGSKYIARQYLNYFKKKWDGV